MRLAAIGSNCIDFYKNMEGGKAFPGGGPVNMAVYTIRMGGSASYIGPVGSDDYGRMEQAVCFSFSRFGRYERRLYRNKRRCKLYPLE